VASAAHDAFTVHEPVDFVNVTVTAPPVLSGGTVQDPVAVMVALLPDSDSSVAVTVKVERSGALVGAR